MGHVPRSARAVDRENILDDSHTADWSSERRVGRDTAVAYHSTGRAAACNSAAHIERVEAGPEDAGLRADLAAVRAEAASDDELPYPLKPPKDPEAIRNAACLVEEAE